MKNHQTLARKIEDLQKMPSLPATEAPQKLIAEILLELLQEIGRVQEDLNEKTGTSHEVLIRGDSA
jgi:hypothetical protein